MLLQNRLTRTILPNVDALILTFIPAKERQIQRIEIMKEEAREKNQTFLQYIVDRNIINFQNYDRCKSAYNKAYGIKFGNLSLPSDYSVYLKKIINFRHNIIHVSPLSDLHDIQEKKKDKYEFSNIEFVEEALSKFDEFIKSLHQATLLLKKNLNI